MANDPSWRIREYRAGDEAACRACVVELQDSERQIDPRLRPGEEMADEYWEAMRAQCDAYAGTVLMAEVGGAVAGLVLILTRVPAEALDEPPGEHALVAELVVRTRWRGRGIGAALLTAAEERARAAGASELRISVLSGNAVARRLYRSRGFARYLETLAKPLRPDGGAEQTTD